MGWSRAALGLALAGAVALAVPAATAAPRHHHHRHHHRHHRSAADRRARTAVGHARRNLPRGWRWPPTRATRRAGRRCLDDLRTLGVHFRRAHRRRLVATPIVVPDLRLGSLALQPTYRKPPFVMDCRLARALTQTADRLVELGVTQLRFSSIYDYRRVRIHHQVLPHISRHALGLAIDVFGVVWADGTRSSVADDYWSFDPRLLLVEETLRQSGAFREILSPAADPDSHGDHIHLEAAVEEAPHRRHHRRYHRRVAHHRHHRHRRHHRSPRAASR